MDKILKDQFSFFDKHVFKLKQIVQFVVEVYAGRNCGHDITGVDHIPVQVFHQKEAGKCSPGWPKEPCHPGPV